ncbi:NAD-dependent epimerase/dehydratase family protein [Actinospica sp.]|jgi:nucleoside-diphosphate-sugar epimerase|uniref:NAD-dependent epimerase/dehydratase family protein n=1 Tax=Actinospica sp. TaxID=1872142 RepID=UPI002CFBDFEC|nr:NAD-dependent epimerase/dehydratase family protein [Actinospica sp.]HWG23447.1 NAD-dependent epimerase/dehydratase family protein [Actinospica sp.]
MAEKILVTGATGKVGQRLVPRLLSWREPGDEVRVLVRSAEAAVRFEAAGAQAVVGDVTDAAARKRALDGATLVVNSAATFRDPARIAADMYAVNRDAAVTLARESAGAGVRRFVQISTNLVYGPGVGRPVREDDELRAEASEAFSAYPHSKREAEEQLRALSAESGLDVITLRLAFVYGEGDPHIVESLPRFTNMAAQQQLAMVHHADVAQGVQRAIRAPRPGGGYAAYNIAGDASSTAVELFELGGQSFDLESAAGREVADPWFGIPDVTRAYRELGFRPIYPTARAAWRDGAL